VTIVSAFLDNKIQSYGDELILFVFPEINRKFGEGVDSWDNRVVQDIPELYVLRRASSNLFYMYGRGKGLAGEELCWIIKQLKATYSRSQNASCIGVARREGEAE
jgi:hypothetical protein